MDMIVIVGIILGVIALVVGCVCTGHEEEIVGKYILMDEDGKEVVVYEVR